MDSVFALSVAQVNQYLKELIASDDVLSAIWVVGEISNFTRHSSGHLYFTLKDDESQLRCVMWRSAAATVRFPIECGVQVIAYGGISVYERGGVYQLVVQNLQPAGQGALFAALEALKRRLEAEGLFALDRKRPLPALPQRVALVTSPAGAAVHDMIRILRQRHPGVEIVVVPCLVQGDLAPESICAALDLAGRHSGADVVIVGRGGGSAEDLWAFNDERVARAISRCPIPVVSAVGHETDVTIADFAADVRAPTPSAAATMVVPETSELRLRVLELADRLQRRATMCVEEGRARLFALIRRPAIRCPLDIIRPRRERLSALHARLLCAAESIVRVRRDRWSALTATLNALSPLAVLDRGYALLTRDRDGAPVTSICHVDPGDTGTIMLKDGLLSCTVNGKEDNQWRNRPSST